MVAHGVIKAPLRAKRLYILAPDQVDSEKYNENQSRLQHKQAALMHCARASVSLYATHLSATSCVAFSFFFSESP
jgi:hypothetical protein